MRSRLHLLQSRLLLWRPSATRRTLAKPGWWRRLRLPRAGLPGGLRPFITLVSLGFVLAALLQNSRQLVQYRPDTQGLFWLCLGVGLSLLSLVVNGLSWAVILRWLGLRPHLEPLVRLYLATNLGKFLPGGVWHLASRVQALRSGHAALPSGASTPMALMAVLLDPLLAAAAALALVPLGGLQNGLALLALVPLVALAPRWLNPLLQRLERKRARQLGLQEALAQDEALAASWPDALDPLALRPQSEGSNAEGPGADGPKTDEARAQPLRPQPPQRGGLRLRNYPLGPLISQLLFVLMRFSGFACCIWAFDLQHALNWWRWLSAFSLAWTAGLVVPGAPGGLGVFESVLLLRLGSALPDPALLAVALGYRLVVTAADLLGGLLASLDGGPWPRAPRPSPAGSGGRDEGGPAPT
jgi:hypothetical protein